MTFPSVYATVCQLQCFWWKMFPFNYDLGWSSAVCWQREDHSSRSSSFTKSICCKQWFFQEVCGWITGTPKKIIED